MRVFMAFALMISCIALVACEDGSIARAKNQVLLGLKDPSSVQWRNVRTCGKDKQWAAGEFNAKNSYGGYDGFKPFIYDGERVHVAGDGTTAPTWLCD